MLDYSANVKVGSTTELKFLLELPGTLFITIRAVLLGTIGRITIQQHWKVLSRNAQSALQFECVECVYHFCFVVSMFYW